MSRAGRRPGSAGARCGWLSALTLLVLLATDLLGAARPAAAGGPPAAEVVPAVVASYGGAGTIAVAVAPLETRSSSSGLRPLALAASVARRATATADNGAVARRPFPTASLVKLFVAEDILHRARAGRLELTDEDRHLLEMMIRRSDDSAASRLWDRFGGGEMVTAVAARYGLRGTAPPRRPGQWEESTTTAQDVARFLARLPVQAYPYDASLLIHWMQLTTPQAADGFDQRFGIFGTVAGRPAVKQGWMCCVGGQRHLHSVGVVGQRVVVLLSEVPGAVGYGPARAALSAAARAIPAEEDR